jgi:hypothetical protein
MNWLSGIAIAMNTACQDAKTIVIIRSPSTTHAHEFLADHY